VTQKSRAEVNAQLDALAAKAKALPEGTVRKLVDAELGRLRKRLEGGERPASISSEAERLARETGLK
jgi:hypothetical protein